MRLLLKYFLPATLVAGFLCSFFYGSVQWRLSLDDSFFDGITHEFGIGKSIALCYEIANGRWFSHLVSCLALYYAGHNCIAYTVVEFLFLICFVASFAFFFRNCSVFFIHTKISAASSIKASVLYTAALYFLLYPGRREIWFWISSSANHLLSVMLTALLLGLLFKSSGSVVRSFLVFITAACIGGLNEVNALCDILLLAGILWFTRKYFPEIPTVRRNFFVAMMAILLSLLVNYLSGGYRVRMEGLPNFTLGQSILNTAHSFLLFFLKGDLATLFEFVFLLALIVVGAYGAKGRILIFNRKNNILLAGCFMLVCLSFFLHCYVLSDVVPPRGALWGYALLLFLPAARLLELGNPVSDKQ
jgi:hypothetical protein